MTMTRTVSHALESLESPFLSEEISARASEAPYMPAEAWDRESSADRQEAPDTEQEVIDKDNRTMVTDTLQIPNRWICAIDVMSENPRHGTNQPYYIAKSRATGTLIGPRHVLTAAHVFGTDAKKAAAVVKLHTVSPARNGSNGSHPFGAVKSAVIQTSQPFLMRRRFTVNGKPHDVNVQQKDDYALIILEKDLAPATHKKIKGTLSHWGADASVAVVRRVEPSAIQSKQGTVIGYPGDTCGTTKWSGKKSNKERNIENCWRTRNDDWASTQWSDSGTLDVENGTTTIFHTADTYEGQSGSPICVTIDNVLHLVGVHTASDNAQRNRGVRVTRRMLSELCGWINAEAGREIAVITNDTLVFKAASTAKAKAEEAPADESFGDDREEPQQFESEQPFEQLDYEVSFTRQPLEGFTYEGPDTAEQSDFEALGEDESVADAAATEQDEASNDL
jgi:V8-like Glu-specific endopeptidase